MTGILYLVGTPIGNLGDFSQRAADTLNNVDFIAAEDTRVTIKLLNNLEIKTPMVSYHEHNMKQRGEMIIKRILGGESCAIVTDAGMPCISDPGEMLVKQCVQAGIKILAVPGPNAAVSAVAVSGLDTGRFCFEGFLSVNKKSRMDRLEELVREKRTLVFYEAPHKLSNTLRDMYKYFGDRRIAIVRELTKIHEEVIRTNLSDAVRDFPDGEIKGEIVLVIEGCKDEAREAFTLSDAVNIALELINDGTSVSVSAKHASGMTGIKKSDIYREILNIQNSGGSHDI